MDDTTSPSITWEIDNFKDVTSCQKSFWEHKTSCKNNNRFFLVYHPMNKLHYTGNQILICLLRASPQTTDVSVLWKMALIKENGDECFLKDTEIRFTVSNVFRPVHGALYSINRGLILNPSNGLLPGGKLLIKYQVIELDKSKLPTADQKLPISNMKALEDYESLLETCKYSDVVFVIGKDSEKKEFRLHKAILATRSEVFDRMFEIDCEVNRFVITDMTVPVFEEMIRYIYTGKIGEGLKQNAEELFVADDKKNSAGLELASKLTVESVSEVLVLADRHSDQQLKTDCIKYITEHVKEVMQTEAWKVMIEPRVDLMVLLYRDIANAK